MAPWTKKKLAAADQIAGASADLRLTAEAASAAFTVVGIVALAALVLATVAIVRTRGTS